MIGSFRNSRRAYILCWHILASNALLNAPHAGATLYYVSSQGNDANGGSFISPWRSIGKAAGTMIAGDSLLIRGGTYAERIIPANPGNAPGQFITYAAYPGESVTVDGTGIPVPTDEGLFFIAHLAYIRIDGLRVINSAYAGILLDDAQHIIIAHTFTSNTASSGIGVWNSRDILVEGNEVQRACWNGMQEFISIAGTDSFEVRDNRVHDGSTGGTKEGICVKWGATNGRVVRNDVSETPGVGIYVDAYDRHTFSIDIIGNRAHDISANGIAIASEQGGLLEHVRVYNNLSWNNKLAGIWVSACCPGVSSHPIHDITIINNTVCGNGWDPWGGGIAVDDNPDVQGVTIRNNIVSRNRTFQIAVTNSVPKYFIPVDHNLIDGYRGDVEEIFGHDSVLADPSFKDTAAHDFHLRAHSAAIDAGSPVDAPATDFDGVSRPEGSGIDIGAYEFIPLPSPPILLSPADGATGIATDTLLIWSGVGGALSYRVQAAADPGFVFPLFNQSGLTGTLCRIAKLSENGRYFWRVNASNASGTGDWSTVWRFTTRLETTVEHAIKRSPGVVALKGNFPNPCSRRTSILFRLNETRHVRLEIIDLFGRRIRTLLDATLPAGAHSVDFDTALIPGGVYVYTLAAGDQVFTGKAVIQP